MAGRSAIQARLRRIEPAQNRRVRSSDRCAVLYRRHHDLLETDNERFMAGMADEYGTCDLHWLGEWRNPAATRCSLDFFALRRLCAIADPASLRVCGLGLCRSREVTHALPGRH